MKYLRILVVLLSIATAGLFGYYRVAVSSEFDKTAPVITADTDEITVSVAATDEELLAGVTAEDDRDGDVTDSLIVESHSKFYGDAKRDITYAAFDEAGNVGSYKRTIVYSDYTSPKFELTAPLRTTENNYNYSVLANMTASDCLDGDISNKIKYKFGEEDSYWTDAGDHLISFQVTNSAGDTSVLELTLQVVPEKDSSEAYPALKQYILYTKVGQAIKCIDQVEGIWFGGSEYVFEDHQDEEEPDYDVSNIAVNASSVDFNTPGVYRIIYTYRTLDRETEEYESHGTVSMFLVVEE